jgi:sugar lactone lactonase YvrE
LALDAAGNLYIADRYNQRIRRVDAATGFIATVAGGGEDDVDFRGDGGPATQAVLDGPEGVTLDPTGNLYIADSGNRRVRRVDAATGTISTVAGDGRWGSSGDGGAATEASLRRPKALALDSSGNLYVADPESRRIRIVWGGNRPALFLRGDSNSDGKRNVSDAVFSLTYLYRGGERPLCLAAADADDDGNLRITDAIYLLDYLFLRGPPIPEPAGKCGEDPSRDDLTCLSYPPCP